MPVQNSNINTNVSTVAKLCFLYIQEIYEILSNLEERKKVVVYQSIFYQDRHSEQLSLQLHFILE